MRARRNERKEQVLEYVLNNPDATSVDVALALDLEIHNARTLLHKYERQGLLSRRQVDFYGTRVYNIKEKGVERLKWLWGEPTQRKSKSKGERREKKHVKVKHEAPTPGREAAAERLRKFAELLSQLGSLDS